MCLRSRQNTVRRACVWLLQFDVKWFVSMALCVYVFVYVFVHVHMHVLGIYPCG